MKYKLICEKDNSGGGSPDGMTSFTFYTLSQAVACAGAWVLVSSSHTAHLWDGEVWRYYT